MATKQTKSIPQLLHDAGVAISNSLADPLILAAVSNFGYDEEKLNAGQTLREEAAQAVHRAKDAAGEQQMATARLKAAEKGAFAAYQDLAKVARAIYGRSSAELVSLGLEGKMPRSTGPFIVQAHQLFNNALLKPELAEYGYDAERLSAERQKIQAYEQTELVQEAAKGTAQQASQEQRDALKTLSDWLARYRKIARVALRQDSQALEKIGIISRTSKTPAQKAAPVKAAITRAAKKETQEEPEPDLV